MGYFRRLLPATPLPAITKAGPPAAWHRRHAPTVGLARTLKLHNRRANVGESDSRVTAMVKISTGGTARVLTARTAEVLAALVNPSP